MFLIIVVLLSVAGIGGILLGIEAFSKGSISLYKDKNITGRPVKIVGVICFIVGIAFLGLVLAAVLLFIKSSNYA